MLNKKIAGNLLLIIFLFFPIFVFADMVLLKSGGILEGQVVGEDGKIVKLKYDSGSIEEIDRKVVASVVKQKELPSNPEEEYSQKSKTISDTDAKAHYELGLFCVKYNMLDYALKEFNRAGEIDDKYSTSARKELEYIDSVKKKADEMADKFPRSIEDLPPLSLDKIADEFNKGNLVFPSNKNYIELIVRVINELSKKDEDREKYVKRYFEIGDDYAKKAKIDEPDAYSAETLQKAIYCYEIAYRSARNIKIGSLSEEKFRYFNDKLEQKKREGGKSAGFPIPISTLDRDAIILFLRSLREAGNKNLYYPTYSHMGDEFKAKVKIYGALATDDDRRNLEIALYSYEIARSGAFKEILTYSFIEAKIKECEEALQNMKK